MNVPLNLVRFNVEHVPTFICNKQEHVNNIFTLSGFAENVLYKNSQNAELGTEQQTRTLMPKRVR